MQFKRAFDLYTFMVGALMKDRFNSKIHLNSYCFFFISVCVCDLVLFCFSHAISYRFSSVANCSKANCMSYIRLLFINISNNIFENRRAVC